MPQVDPNLTTGLDGLDRVLKGLIPGDNIVWQVDEVADVLPWVGPYTEAARTLGRRLIYFRFARHQPLVTEGAEVHPLDPAEGFEPFINEIHETIARAGYGGFYLFDCLTDLAADWYSDQMLGNFFMLTCPYLYDVEALAYFVLLRSRHSFHATSAIAATTQVLLDVYRHGRDLYLHPWKVQARFSPTMHMLHAWRDGDFQPVMDSATISEIRTAAGWSQLGSGDRDVGIWNETLRAVEEDLREGRTPEQVPAAADRFRRLARTAITRDDRVLALVERYLRPRDLVAIGNRMIGTGLIGGKSVGMLLAQAILRAHRPRLARRLEPHDSFYIGSDVFYTYLVQNGLWWLRERQKDPDRFLEGALRGRHLILTGSFPPAVQTQFEDMLDYFGQSPIIVRSSSLLEDNFGNAFAGKYESVFCVNQGPRSRRLDDFLSAVRTIYASTMSEKALTYRRERGLLDRDEQMALLVQRVSGSMVGELFFPQIAGVGFSFNPYVWSRQIDPEAGMLRLVFGLGTRAVDRADDDYTRVVALNAPTQRPEANYEQAAEYTQRKVDVLDLQANQLVSMPFRRVAEGDAGVPLELFTSRPTPREGARPGAPAPAPLLTFEELLARTPFVQEMRTMLRTLHEAYDYPVDVEFTANFRSADDYKVNLVQCRPLQVQGGGAMDAPPEVPEADRLLEARGAVIGQGRRSRIDRVLYVCPATYGALPIRDRHSVARLIGQAVHADADDRPVQMLLGPGRWGTGSPSLGVPVRFAEINRVAVLCEIVAMRDDLVPDVSLGTHFFSDLVEAGILYFALFPDREGNRLRGDVFEGLPNRLAEHLPDAARWQEVVWWIDAADLPDGAAFRVHADPLQQRVVAYLERDGTEGG